MDIVNMDAVTKQKEQIENTRKSLGSFKATEKLKIHKQKSLLQFFYKSPATTSGSCEEQSVDLVHDTCELGDHVHKDLQNEVVKTPNSNKENTKITEIEKVTVDEQNLSGTKPKSKKKKHTEKSKKNGEINEPVDAMIKYNNIPEIDSKSEFTEREDIFTVNEREDGGDQMIDKHEEKHKRECEVEIENNSNSLCLIADSCLSNQSSIILNSESCKQELQSVGPEIGIEKKNHMISKLSKKDEQTIVTSSVSYSDSKTLIEVDSDISGVSFPKTGEMENNDTSQKVNACSFSEFENVAVKGKVDNINLPENHKKSKSEENTVNVKNDFEGDSKKKTLKGKDMLNILKEIKSEDFTDKSKKKHKKKHKHKSKSKMSEIEIHNIAQCNEPHEGEDLDIAKISNDKDIVDSAGAKQSSESIEIREKKSTNLEPFAEIKMGICQTEKRNELHKKDLKHIKSLHKECTDRTTNVESNKVENKNVKSMHNKLGNKSLCDNLNMGEVTESENKIINNGMSVKEMSYTEYLEKLKTEEVNIKCTSVETTLDGDEIAVVAESNLSRDTCTENVNSKGNIKSFFKSLTSTSDDIKQHQVNTIVNSNISARKDKKLKSKPIAGKKSKMAVGTNDSETAQKEVNKSIKSQCDECIKSQSGEAVDVLKPVECRTKIDPPIKNLFLRKRTQTTLSFGRSGLTVAIPSPVAAENVVKSNSRDSNKRKCLRASRLDDFISEQDEMCKQDRFDDNAVDTNVLEMPVNGMNKDVSFVDEPDSAEKRSSERRRSLRNRYTVEAFQMDADRKTPIKIKLKMCPKNNSSVGDGDFLNLGKFKKSKKNIQQYTANALLKKAKRGISKLVKDKTDEAAENISRDHKNRKKFKEKDLNLKQNSDNSNKRRSSRLVGKAMPSMEEVSLDNIVVSSDEEDDAATPAKKHGKHKGPASKYILGEVTIDLSVENTPKEKNATLKHKKTPSKSSGVKLAPVFLMGKNKPAEPSPKTPAIDPELLKQRQQFLMSGVPEELRKQSATRVTSQISADYPPLPIISHVLQIPKGTEIGAIPRKLDVWNLPTVQLDLRQFLVPGIINTMSRFNGNLVEQCENQISLDVGMFKKFKNHPALTNTQMDLCLKEIGLCNRSYPTVDMFSSLKEMKIAAEQNVAKTDLKGIVGACSDMIMVNDAENNKGQKKNTKKGLKRKKKGVGNCSLEQDKTSEKPELQNIAGSTMLWTEKYSPAKSSDVLGNSGLLKKLSKWLNDWRHVLDKEARKAQKLLLENKRTLTNTKSDDADWESSSDFNMDIDNGDGEMSLSNTMLLTGPHGCGKTSSVYALAQELGFKVHEVNASSCRSGKHILSQLQEATQSHQVTSQGSHTPKKTAGILAAANTCDAQGQSKGSNKVKKGLDMAMANNPKKRLSHKLSEGDDKSADKIASRNQSGNVKRKSITVQNIEETSSLSVPHSINLSSTTLILFDEVDIVLEEDKGFLSAVQTFMSTTKIPIILTSADPGFTEQLEGRFETMPFQRPTTASITSHLQTIALCEGLRLDPLCLSEMIQYYQNDIRRCIIMLQFLLQTGGAEYQVSKTFPDHLDSIQELMNSKQPDEFLSSQNSDNIKIPQHEIHKKTDNCDMDDEFVVLKPLKKRRRIIEDENSNSAQNCDNQVLVTTDATVKKCPVHCVRIESLVGICSRSLVDTWSHGVNASSNVCIQELVTACDTFKKSTNTDISYNNLHHLLPLPVNIVDTIVSAPQPVCKIEQSRKRIHVNSDSNDVCDNEMSCDSSKLDIDDNNADDTKLKSDKNSKEENKVLIESLSAFSRFYETMSSLDMYESVKSVKRMDKLQCNGGQLGIKGSLVAGVENVHSKHWKVCELDMDTCIAFHSEIEARSARKLYRDIEIIYNKAEKLKDNNTEFSGNFVLPVMKQEEQFTTLDHSIVSIPQAYESACDNAIQSLPIPVVNQQRNVHLDYLPTLREICRIEQCREIINTKRRFHHYFNSISLPLKDKSISTLATTFIT